MKKFLPLFLAVCLVFALAVNVSASDYQDLVYPDEMNKGEEWFELFPLLESNAELSAFITNDDRLTLIEGALYVDTDTIRNVKDNAKIDVYLYDYQSDVWVYQATDYYDEGVNIGKLNKLVWSRNVITDRNGIFVFDGDPYFKAGYEEVLSDSLDDTYNTILSVVGTLLTVGLAIMAVFVGVSLVPRIIYKFL